MENATKALLIAAGVLIVIVIVALGVKILGGAGDTGKSGEQVGKEISSATEQASYNLKLQNYELIYKLETLTVTDKEDNNFVWGCIPIIRSNPLKSLSAVEFNKKYLISIDSVTDAKNRGTGEELIDFTLELHGLWDQKSKALKFNGEEQSYVLNANCKKVQYVETKIPKPSKWTTRSGQAVNDKYLDLALYCGIAGKCANNTITFNGIRIYKEK